MLKSTAISSLIYSLPVIAITQPSMPLVVHREIVEVDQIYNDLRSNTE